MILVIDVGNTNIKLALCEKEEILISWRISVKNNRTADEFGVELLKMFQASGYTFDTVEGVIISSVVPSVNYTLTHACEFYLHKTPIMVSCELKTGLTYGYADPTSLGADRIANAVGAITHYGAPCIIFDLGTASTFGVVDRNNCFLGGCIAPGIKTSLDALSTQASKLPLVELVPPASIIADNTTANLIDLRPFCVLKPRNLFVSERKINYHIAAIYAILDFCRDITQAQHANDAASHRIA